MGQSAARKTGSASHPVTLREAVGLALPAVAAALLHHAYRPLDQYFVQGLGYEAQGALGTTTFVLILIHAIFLLVAAGAGPLVARATGAKDWALRRGVIGTALRSALVLGLFIFVLGCVGVPPIVWTLGLEGDTKVFATLYLQTLFLSGFALAFSPVVDASFNAMGNTRLPMLLQGAAVVINAALTPFLIYTCDMGIRGAALGTTISQTIVVVVGGFLLWKQAGLSKSDLQGKEFLGPILRIGWPMAASTGTFAGVYWVIISLIVAPLGPSVMAGLGIGFSALEAFTWPIFWGWSIAVSSIVGRRLGAKEPDDAWRVVRLSVPVVFSTGLGFGLVFYFLAPGIVGIFTSDPEASAEAIRYAMILAWVQPIIAMEALWEGVLIGAGDTRKVFWSTVPLNLLRIPLGWFLAVYLGYGAVGLWWGINISTFLKWAVKTAMVYHGGWAKLELIKPAS